MAAWRWRAARVPWAGIAGEALARVLLVAKTAAVVHLVNHHLCGLALVVGPSMLPTLNTTGDVVAVERLSAKWGELKNGDVVLFRSPADPTRIVTKRVVGTEGDAVTFRVDPLQGGESTSTVVVPKGHVWVQGDNIYDSKDSRQFGPVSLGLIQGRAFLRVWPPEDFGFIGQEL